MARAITAGELTKLRTEGQATRLYLVVDVPAVVFKARVNQSFTSLNNVTQITYDTVTAGAFGDVQVDMTLYIGSSEGAYDIGVGRIRKAATSSILYVGAISDMALADNLYLTVVDEYAPFARQAETDSDGVVTMDTDVAYADQHENMDPVPVMGPDAVKWLSSATVDVDWDGSDSWVLGANISGHSWSFPSASGTADTATATPTATYNATGRYLVADTVSADNGASFIGRRNTYIVDDDTSFLTTQFALDELVGTRDDGGWSMRVILYDQALRSEIRDRAKIVLFARDRYSGTEESLGPVADRESVVFIGWAAEESIYYNPNIGSVEFTVMGSGVFLQHIESKPVLLTDTYYDGAAGGVPSSWTEFESLSVDEALFHIARWRSTLTRCMDVYKTGDGRQAAYFSLGRSSIYEQILEAAQRIFAMPLGDRYGRMFIEIDPQMVETGDRGSIPIVMTITEADWRDEIEIYRNELDETALVEVTGTFYSIGSELVFGGRSPGDASKRFGEFEQFDDILVESQVNTNTLAGLYCGWLGVDYPETTIVLAANNRFFDIAPQQYGRMSIAEADTERGIVWTNQDMIPRGVEYTHDPATGILTPIVIFEQENSEENSITFYFPGGSGDGSTDIPPGGEPPPEPPPFDPPLPIEDPPEVDDAAYVFACTASAAKVTQNFSDDTPTWADKTGALSGEEIIDASQATWDETRNTVYVATSNAIWKTADLLAASPTWTKVYDADSEYSGLDALVLRVICAKTENKIYGLMTTRSDVGSDDADVYCLRSDDNGASWNAYEVYTKASSYSDFTVQIRPAGNWLLEDNITNDTYHGYGTFSRKGSTPQPWGIAYLAPACADPRPKAAFDNNASYQDTDLLIHPSYGGTADDVTIAVCTHNSSFGPGDLEVFISFLNSYFGPEDTYWSRAGLWSTSMPFEAARVRVGVKGVVDNGADPIAITTFAFWNAVSVDVPTAMDIGKHNDNLVYIGSDENIYQSSNGGELFTVWIPDASAYDIECHRGQDANDLNIKYWDADGKLWYPWRTTPGNYRYQEDYANKVIFRIASDPVLGLPTFTLPGTGAEVYSLVLNKQPYSTVHDTKQTSLPAARSLGFYRGDDDEARKLFYLTSTAINYSGDYGDTITDKTGDWSSFGGPIRVFPLLEGNEAAA